MKPSRGGKGAPRRRQLSEFRYSDVSLGVERNEIRHKNGFSRRIVFQATPGLISEILESDN
jgi:hypothetical protein